MRNRLSVEDLDDFIDSAVLATLATYRRDGTILLSPVWFEWRNGGFNVVVGVDDAKARHLRRDPRVSLVVYQNRPPYKGVEITTDAVLSQVGAIEVERRLALRHLGPEVAEDYLTSSDWDPLLVRLESGTLRVWDFADEWPEP